MSGSFVFLAFTALFGILSSTKSFSFGLSCFLCIILFLRKIKGFNIKQLFFIMVVFTSYFFVGAIDQYTKSTTLTGEERQFVVKITEPWRVDGDHLQTVVKLPGHKEKLLLKYRIKTEKEKQYFSNATTYPQQCKVNGRLQRPSPARNEHAFNYQDFLQSKHIHWLLNVDRVEQQHCQPLKPTATTKIAKLRHYGIKHIEQHFPERTKPVVAALLFGERTFFDEKLLENYRRLGVIHLLAISGLHVGLLVGLLYYVAIRSGLTKERTIKIILLLLPIYALLTGAAPSVIRAVLMIYCLLITRLLKIVKIKPLDSISIAFLLCLVVQPTLLFHPGFQLSFLVSFSLILSAPVIFKRYSHRVVQLFVVSFTAQISSLPILLFHFYEFSFIAAFMNILYVPVFSMLILPLSLLTFLVSIILPLLIQPLYFLLSAIIFVLDKLTNIFGSIPIATITLGKPSPFIFILYFLVCSYFFYQWEKNRPFKRQLQYFLLIVLICMLHWLGNVYSPFGRITFIDVGQGDSILIQLPFNRGNYLIDTGGSPQFMKEAWQERKRMFDTGSDIVVPFLKSNGITKINKLILTHGDIDHIGGASSLLEELTVTEILLPKVVEKSEVEEQLIHQARKKEIPIRFVVSGEKWKSGEALFQVLSPPNDNFQLDKNNGSIVLFCKIGELSWLFTGDLEEEGEQLLMKAYPTLQANVLKVGHHGSRTSSTIPFLEQVQANYAIISAGDSNRYGHPHQEVLARLSATNTIVFRTDKQGAITYSFFYKRAGTFSHMIP